MFELLVHPDPTKVVHAKTLNVSRIQAAIALGAFQIPMSRPRDQDNIFLGKPFILDPLDV